MRRSFWNRDGKTPRDEKLTSAIRNLEHGDHQLGDLGSGETSDALRSLARTLEETAKRQQAEEGARREREDRIADQLRALARGATKLESGTPSSEPIDEALVELVAAKCERQMGLLSEAVDVASVANENVIAAATVLTDSREVETRTRSIAAATDELVTTIATIAEIGERSSSATREMRDTSGESRGSTERALDSMGGLVHQVRDCSAKVESLEKALGAVDGIATSIRDIASRTNLLALNATIEAASAGQAGRGFAVVASEVKELAQQTTQATAEIEQQIGGIRSEMTGIAELIHQVVDNADEAQESAQSAREGLEAIAGRIDEVDDQTAEMARILMEQKQASNEVAQQIALVSEATQSNSSAVDQIFTSASALGERSRESAADRVPEGQPASIPTIAKLDHVVWKKRLAEMMAGKESLDPDELADQHACRLGLWYDSVQDPAILESSSFRTLADPHRRVHEHGICAARYYHADQHEDALREIGEIERASVEVVRLLDEIIASLA